MAPSPSSSGISRSMVTTSGSYWWTLRTASNPSRAVATTRYAEASTSVMTRRMRALSSTTSTVDGASDDCGTLAHRADLHPPVPHVEPDRTPALPTHRLGLDRD